MKTTSTRALRQGSVLMTTLVITGILGLTLASYLTLISNQNRSVWRSQTWNASIPISEAGIEEAIVHLNKNCLWSDITRAPTNWTADGWVAVSNGVQMSRWLGENKYTVTIVTAPPFSMFRPAILSEGDVPSLLVGRSPEALFATIGTEISETRAYVGRKVKATTASDGIFAKAMVARQSIDLSGNNVSTDSFDSSDPAYSTLGLYDPNPLKTKDNGDVAVNLGVVNTLGIGNANISGRIATGPGGSISIGPNGKVGDKGWMASGNTGIQPGRSRDDMNVSFPDVNVPFNGGYSTPGPETVTNAVVSQNSITNTSASYPTGEGIVYTNTITTTSISYPSSGSYLGTVNTNLSYTTTATYPTAGTYIGIVTTNTTSVTTTDPGTTGTYIGGLGTNTVSTFSTNYPAAGTYIGSVLTNTALTTAPYWSYPPTGTYLGNVITNTQGNGEKANSIISFTYNKIIGYTCAKITGYSYEQIAGFSYWKIVNYTYALIASYSLVSTVTVTNSVVTVNYDYVLDSGNYKLSDIHGKVLITGDATLYVTDSVNFTGNDFIKIDPGASLKMYVSASSARLGGNGVINSGGNATNFYYYGLPSNTDLNFGGNANFTGVVYAPQADFHIGGGGNDTYDFVGASVTKTVQMNGKFRFHYDEALNKNGPSRGYIIQSWDEIKLTDTQ